MAQELPKKEEITDILQILSESSQYHKDVLVRLIQSNATMPILSLLFNFLEAIDSLTEEHKESLKIHEKMTELSQSSFRHLGVERK